MCEKKLKSKDAIRVKVESLLPKVTHFSNFLEESMKKDREEFIDEIVERIYKKQKFYEEKSCFLKY